jgi:hypothetical protein
MTLYPISNSIQYISSFNQKVKIKVEGDALTHVSKYHPKLHVQDGEDLIVAIGELKIWVPEEEVDLDQGLKSECDDLTSSTNDGFEE